MGHIMVKMVTKKPHDYAGRQLHEGDEFEAEDAHVQLLTVLGRAEVIAPDTLLIKPAFTGSGSQRAILKRKA